MKFVCVRSLASISVLSASVCLSQSILVPEYYGIYAYANGQAAFPAASAGLNKQSAPFPSGNKVTGAGGKVAARYIEAIQKGDFRTVIDLSYGYQADIVQIKAHNPEVLWPKLTDQYYDSRIVRLSKKPDSGTSLATFLQGMTGDPAQQIRFMQNMVLPNAKWKVTETRTEHVRDQFDGHEYDRTVVYITVTFPTLQDSPFVGGNFLKETILEVDLNVKLQQVMTVGRVAQGDTAWDAPVTIMNAKWQREGLAGMGGLSAEAFGGKAPYTWRPVCVSHDLSNSIINQPSTQQVPASLVVNLQRFPTNVTFPLRCSLTVTDGNGQSDAVEITVPQMLTGFSDLCYVREPWLSRGQGRPEQSNMCLNPIRATDTVSATIASAEPTAAYSRPGGTSPASRTGSDGGGSSPSGSAPSAGCSDYNSCFKAGISAFEARDLSGAEADFRAATKFSPDKEEAWRWVGTVMLGNNEVHQVGELASVWDKALSLGGPLIIPACHERIMQACERGDLWLSPKLVAFRMRGTQQVFSAPPSDVGPGKVLNNSAAQHISYSLKAAGKNYSLDFVPSSWQTCNFNLMVQCQPDGTAEQLILANYVSQTLPKLASGQFAANTVSPAPAPATGPKTSSGPTGCAALSGAGYSILLKSHLYKVVSGPQKQPYFLNESGSQMTDASFLSQLASVVWTHDNVLPDARTASSHLSGILGTSKTLQTYSARQDAIARAMVEAMEGAATDGASLVSAPGNLTAGILKSQLTNAPKTILILTAQHGLSESLSLYKQMESVPLPPSDATVLNASDMAKIQTLYTQAHTLDLAYSALAAKLMPQQAQDLTDAGIKSIIGELTAGPVFAGSPNATVTLQQLLQLQTSLANLAKGNVALQAFHDNLNLAMNLNKANNGLIEKMATTAANQLCKQ